MVTLVGLGVFGFIVMDVVNNRNMMGQNTTVGKVNGKSLEINQMRYMEDVMYQGSNADEFSKKDYVWNNFIESSIADNITENVGLDVGKNELLSLEFGPNYSGLIISRFGNPQTGEPNVSQLNQIRQAIKENKLPAELISFWSLQEKEIIKDRIIEKLGNLVGKAMYVPTWQTRMMVDQQLMKTTALVVKIPYTTVPDNEVTLTDADYQKFLDGRKGSFDNEKETRSLDYIIIDAAPTAADSAQISQLIANKAQAFRTANNDSTYVEANGGKFTDTYAKAETFNEKVRAQLISLAPGEVYGPYEEAGYFKLAKMISKRTVADSVKSRHILIPAQDEAGMAEANRKIDSIKVAIESGKTKFEDAAKAMSQDQGSAMKGGELGFAGQGQMVKPFNDAIFFKLDKGQMKKVTAQFGVHLVQVLDKKTIGNGLGYKLEYISERIIPSETTQLAAKEKAEKILQTINTTADMERKFKSGQEVKMEEPVQVSSDVATFPGAGQTQGARDIVKWLFKDDTKVGSVSKNVFPIQNQGDYFPTKYIIAGLKAILPKGPPTLDMVRDVIKPAVIAHKKGEMLLAKFKKGNSLEEVAANYNVKVDTIRSITAGSPFIQGLGNEPKFGAVMTVSPLNKMTNPIVGNGALLIGMPIKRESDQQRPTDEQSKSFYNNMGRNQVVENVKQSLIKGLKIEDNRLDFY